MSKWRQSPPELIALFAEVRPDHESVEPKKMFGYPCCFANGNLFCGLHQENLIIRLPEDKRAKFLQEYPGTTIFEPMPGRQMKEYVQAPPALLQDKKKLRAWLAEGLAYALSLPFKASKKGRKG